MSVWIEAEDEQQARAWGKRILEEFVRQRFRFSNHKVDPTEFEGELETDPEVEEVSKGRTIPTCRLGEIPNWEEPWKNDAAIGPPRVVPLDGRS